MKETVWWDQKMDDCVDLSFDLRIPRVIDDAYRKALKCELQAYHKKLFAGKEALYQIAEIRDFEIEVSDGERIPVRQYVPPQGRGKSLIFFHGGAFIAGSVQALDPVCRYLCNHTDLTVFSVEYRLAPQHKFPIPLNDCFDAFEAILRQADDFQINPNQICIGGDSAGGNLSAGVARMAHIKGYRIRKQLLIYPCMDMTVHQTDTMRRFGKGYLLDTDELEKCSFLYAGTEETLKNPLVSPLLAEDFSGQPETFAVLAGCCPLTRDGLSFLDCLQRDGVCAEYKIYEGMPHGFIIFDYEKTYEALDDICHFLKNREEKRWEQSE